MTKIKINEFHVPFIKELVFVSLITIVSMISIRFFIEKHDFTPQETSSYTSDTSHSLVK
jgi:hypothetical protein